MTEKGETKARQFCSSCFSYQRHPQPLRSSQRRPITHSTFPYRNEHRLQMFHLFLSLLLLATAVHSIPPSDFIVIGAGTSGCTLAGTLCRALPKATITLIEQGDYRDRTMRLRTSAASQTINTWFDPSLATILPSTPQRALNNRSIPIIIPRNLAGSSAINAGQLYLPERGTFDSWRISGLTDTRAEHLFRRVQTALLANSSGIPPDALKANYSEPWQQAAIDAGLPFTSNPYVSARTATNVFAMRAVFDTAGRRVDACRAFLRPARSVCGGRLKVLRGLRVQRILFRGGRVARSVVVVRADGRKSRVHAHREVLVAAGVIESATLLQRSGVGPREKITGMVKRFVKDLPVGENLQVRPSVRVFSTYDGPLAVQNVPGLFENVTARATFRAGRGGPLGMLPFGPMFRMEGLGYGGMQSAFEPDFYGRKLISTYCLSNVGSGLSGSVLMSNGALPAKIDLALLERDEDFDTMLRCFQRIRGIHKELERLIGAKEVFPPGVDASVLESREVVETILRSQAGSPFHYVGSCSVGKVVDSNLKVIGLERVRVIDSSVLRSIPRNAGPMASVYVVGLHAADLVAKDHSDLA